ncbi:MAG TPA: LUD domain-containing protein [Acidobacteriota bacterium]|nr:LUD domain-containing protein [Acidobacteriota bacterium]
MSSRDLQSEIRDALLDPALQQAVPTGTRAAAARRRVAVADFSAYEACRDRARAIKEDAIERLPELLETLTEAVNASGGFVHRADDAEAACRIIVEIARREGLTAAVKSKSMTSEEIHLNVALEGAGVSVRETDLGEYIVQLDEDRPSHAVAPIIHKSLEDVRNAFRRGLGRDDVPETAEELTQLARQQLRSDFLEADLGITGANFLIAESGTVIIVENEGNARLTTQVPRVHVALAGIEKILPTMADLEPFIELLPRSGTGQLLTSYLSVITGPGWGASPLTDGPRRFHLVLLDNGRSGMRDDPVLRETLYCVRCGACMNVCAPYQAVGGHVFGGATYQSGIGVAWEAGVRGLDAAAEFNELCTTCSRCQDVCPVRIDIPWMNSAVRGRIRDQKGGGAGPGAELLTEPRRLYQLARRARPVRRLMQLPPARWALERLFGVDRRRPLPEVPDTTLADWFSARGGRVVGEVGADPEHLDDEAEASLVVFWADCHSNYADVDVAKAAVGVIERLGFTVLLATGPCCGRAALSQGALDAAREQAFEVSRLLAPYADRQIPIVGLEPSCLTCVAEDHTKLSPANNEAFLVGLSVREIMVFLEEHAALLGAALAAQAPRPRHTVALHGHCQQKSAGWLDSSVSVLTRLPGVEVVVTTAECCGMAGSFGYKPEGYEVSRELGTRLVAEISGLESVAGGPIDEVLASGMSCRTQLADFGDRRPRHPVQLVAEAIGATADSADVGAGSMGGAK